MPSVPTRTHFEAVKASLHRRLDLHIANVSWSGLHRLCEGPNNFRIIVLRDRFDGSVRAIPHFPADSHRPSGHHHEVPKTHPLNSSTNHNPERRHIVILNQKREIAPRIVMEFV